MDSRELLKRVEKDHQVGLGKRKEVAIDSFILRDAKRYRSEGHSQFLLFLFSNCIALFLLQNILYTIAVDIDSVIEEAAAESAETIKVNKCL